MQSLPLPERGFGNAQGKPFAACDKHSIFPVDDVQFSDELHFSDDQTDKTAIG